MKAKRALLGRWYLHAAAAAVFLFALAILASQPASAAVDVGSFSPDISFSNDRPVDGENVTIHVAVRNFGNTTATNVMVSASLTSTNELLGQTTLASVEAQGFAVADVSWSINGEGNMTVTIVLSPAEVDANPGNNVAVSANLFVYSRPDLKVDSVTFDNPTPSESSGSVEIRVTVSNIGGSAASIVVIGLYDGDPAKGASQFYNTTILSVPVDSPQTLTYSWGISDKGGRHDVYAVVLSSMPAEKASNLANNWATGRVLVLTQFDVEITTTRTIDYNPLFKGFLIIRNGGNLTLSGAAMTLLQERDNQFDIIVESGGKLYVNAASITSQYQFGLTLMGGGWLYVSGGATFGGSVTSSGGGFSCVGSTISGGLDGTYSAFTINTCTVNGDIVLWSTDATVDQLTLNSPGPFTLHASTLDARWVSIPAASPSGLVADMGSVAQVAGLEAGGVDVETGSTVSLWRELTLHVADFTGIPLVGAHVEMRFSLSLVSAGNTTAGSGGTATVWLLTDLLTGSFPLYVGSYLFDATFAAAHAQASTNLMSYPTLTAESNMADLDVIFGVIDPSALFAATPGDKDVGPGTSWTIGNFDQDGNLFLKGGLVDASGTLTLDQDWAFQKAIVLRQGTLTVHPGGCIDSPFRFNIYLYNDSSLVVDGGCLNLNAVVTIGSLAKVTITNSSTVHGSFILNAGASFLLGSGSVATSPVFYARGGISVDLTGATMNAFIVDLATSSNIVLNNTALTSSGDLKIQGTVGTSAVTITNSQVNGGALWLQGQTIEATGTDFSVSSVATLWANTVTLRTSTFTAPLAGFKPGSGGTFTDVTYPSADVNPTAIIHVLHTLSLSVLDDNDNAVVGGQYAMRQMPNATTDTFSGELTRTVAQVLHAATIAGGVETFDGNYRVTVALTGAAPQVYFVVMDAAKSLVIRVPGEVVPPATVIIDADADPAEVTPGQNITITGYVELLYEGKPAPIPPRNLVEVSFWVGTQQLGSTSTFADGTFNWTGPFAADNNDTGIKTVKVQASYLGVQGSYDLQVTLNAAPPTTLILELDNRVFEKRQGEGFTIGGHVTYDNGHPAPGVKIAIGFLIPPAAGVYLGTTDENGVFAVGIPGRGTASTYSLSVSANDEGLGISSPPSTVTLTVTSGVQVGENQGLGALALPIIAIVIAAAAGIIGFLVISARRKAVNYVECGNCNRPVHEGEKKCPSCGVEFEEDIAKCSHCASWIPANANRCPKCGTEFKPIDEALAESERAAGGPPGGGDNQEARAEVTTPSEPVRAAKQAVPVKKKVLKQAVPAAGEGEDPFAGTAAPAAEPAAQQPAQQPAPEKKPEEKKEKGLFDDL